MKRRSTARFVVAISLSLVGLALAVIGGVAEAALLVAPWFVLLVLGLSAERGAGEPTVEVALESDRAVVGDSIETTTNITLPTSGVVRIVQGEHGSVHVCGAGEPVTVTSETVARQWGVHSLDRTQVHLREPFGLFGSSGVAEAEHQVRVHPTTMELRELITPWVVRRISGTHPSRSAARGIEFADIRPFTAGDSVRDINWRASARSSDLLVSDRHPDRATDVVLLVDSFVESGHDARLMFGMTVEASLAIAESHLGATDRVGLVEFGGLVRWVVPGVGGHQLQRLTDALLATGLYANSADRQFPTLPPKALPPRSFLIAITPLLDQRFIDAIFEARSRGHDVAVIECLTPDSFAGSEVDGGAGETEEPHTRPLARRFWRAEQQLLRDRMAEHGIAVAPWTRGDHVDVVIDELLRRRQRGARVARR